MARVPFHARPYDSNERRARRKRSRAVKSERALDEYVIDVVTIIELLQIILQLSRANGTRIEVMRSQLKPPHAEVFATHGQVVKELTLSTLERLELAVKNPRLRHTDIL